MLFLFEILGINNCSGTFGARFKLAAVFQVRKTNDRTCPKQSLRQGIQTGPIATSKRSVEALGPSDLRSTPQGYLDAGRVFFARLKTQAATAPVLITDLSPAIRSGSLPVEFAQSTRDALASTEARPPDRA